MKMNCRGITRLEEVVDEECLVLDEHLVATKWARLERACERFFNITELDIERERSTPRNVSAFFDACDGIRTISPWEIMSAYTGNTHGGHSDHYVVQGNQRQSYLCALTSERSIEVMIEAIYVAFELPMKKCFWHGFNGRDYNLLRGARWMAAAIEQRQGTSSDIVDREEIKRPCGIRLVKHRGSYRLGCLASNPNGEIVNMSLSIDDGESARSPMKSCCKHLAYIFIDHRHD